jgi:glycerophosphoryl diester phosphodiesterase
VTKVIAHRGASRVEAENTTAAFRRARTLGADWVELDVRLTADGRLAVHHDAHLPDGRPVAETPAASLPASVPSLAKALAACAGMGVNVEIKSELTEPSYDPARIAAAVVAEVGAWGGPVLVSSFDLATIDAVHSHGVATAWLVLTVDDAVLSTLADHGHDALHPWEGAVTEDLVARCHAAGVEVNVWTVDDAERMRQLAAWGVDGIVTNVPDVAITALRD